ncbi:MAG: DUF4442 domain-containing protein [Bdellovibrio sp.]
MKALIKKVEKTLPSKFKDTLYVNLFGLVKIPLIAFIGPKVERLDEQECRVVIPLRYRTKNHLGAMYFGVLCAAADISGGLLAMKLIEESGEKISLVFKDFKAEFLKRVEGDCLLVNKQGPEVKEFIKKVIASGERENMTVVVEAFVPKKLGDEVVARFELTLSLKKRS